MMSNGKYKSAWHRINPTKEGKHLLVASFINSSYNAMVYPAPKLTVHGDEAYLYPNYIFGDYMTVYMKQKYEDKEPRFVAMRPFK